MDSAYLSGSGSDEAAAPPKLFINWSVLQGMLQQNTDDEECIQHTLLLKLDGALLTASYESAEAKAANKAAAEAAATAAAAAASSSAASAASAASSASAASASSSALVSSSGSATPPPAVLPKILGALVAHIFRVAEQNGASFLGAQQLNMLMLECEGGVVAVARLSRFLLCMYATKGVNVGTLRAKMNEMILKLQPLNRVYAN